jgi:5-methyltetrahydrofolate--homocysteine methyltransferase
VDCLTLAVGADTNSVMVTMETMKRVKTELGLNLVLGASNVSFGLPDRDLLNNAFVVLSMSAGADCLIVDAAKVSQSVSAADLLLAHDKEGKRYIKAYRQRKEAMKELQA